VKMRLTIKNRLILCWEILTVKSGHVHNADEKQLSTFIRGYEAGRKDQQYENTLQTNLDRAPECNCFKPDTLVHESCPVHTLKR